MQEQEAELLGMHAGDGTLYKAGKTLVWEMRGSVQEKEYYDYVAQLLENLFKIQVTPKFRGPTSYGIQTTKKAITSFLIEKGFASGSKVYRVRIPEYIQKADEAIRLSFIRGLFDTDGCVRFEKNRTKEYYYPRIEFSFASKQLRDDLQEVLIGLGFRVYVWQDRTHSSLGLAGFENLQKWLQKVKPANNKHLERVKKQSLKSPLISSILSHDGTAVTPTGC